MEGAARRAMKGRERSVLVAIPNGASSQRLLQEIGGLAGEDLVAQTSSLVRLREAIRARRPEVILLDDRLLHARPLAESVGEFSGETPTILTARYERQAEVASLIADGQVEFVPRTGKWTQLAASLIQRRLRWAEIRKNTATVAGQNIGELFRHEINNPLTGILGNAELILAHSDRLPAIDTQRIRTVVELAVRLRETVRRVSNAWEDQTDSAKSA